MSHSSNEHPYQRIMFLDYLRVFAFVSVLIGHKFYGYIVSYLNNNDFFTHNILRIILEPLLMLFYGGGAGVIVFFLVSGYIITHVLKTEKTKIFLVRRWFRIYPLYIVAVLLEVLRNYFFIGFLPSVKVLIPQLLLIGDFFGTPYSLGGVEWTLRIEVLF